MLKEYKLIKKYPSLPKDWEVGMIVGLGDRPALYSPCHGKYSNKYLSDQEIENQIEFWEVVVEKDYEILELSFKRSERPEIRSVVGFSDGYITALLKCENTIHSVKRLSDGKVFTIGDKFKNDKINMFELFQNTIIAKVDKWNWTKIAIIKEVPKPVLFTTEDGVDIYQFQEVFVVNDDLSEYFFRVAGILNKRLGDTRHYFSSKEKAKEYILMNKPCLSIVEIAPLIGRANMGQYIDLTLLTKNLKYLVKSKI